MMTDGPGQDLVSAVIIPVPQAVAVFTERVRRSCGAGCEPVPPHITILWPFVTLGTVVSGVDQALLTRTSAQLQAVCRRVAPFSVTLDRYGLFAGAVNTLYLALRDSRSFLAMYEQLHAVFPAYPLYEGQFAEVIPHLTLVKSEQPLDISFFPSFDPFTFTVTAVHFMYGDASFSQPWTLGSVIPLGENA